ncbi:MAG: hypothetical protein KGL40_11440 [Rhodocyclaceae bacterium]|nr:hypothetical protein [Rhodocyclaceae bacterium]
MALDDLDDVAQLIVMPPDFPHRDLSEVASKLANNDVFIPGYIPAPGSLYDPNTYLSDAVSGTTTILLADRNIVSPIVRLTKGLSVNAEGPIAAGILAFAQLSILTKTDRCSHIKTATDARLKISIDSLSKPAILRSASN